MLSTILQSAKTSKYTILVVLGAFSAWFLYIAFHYNGTGDSGDAIYHFQFAQAAFKHPELYLDHWGKPVFTLLASPFAQMGFIGVKLFNILVTLGAYYMTYEVARKLDMQNAWTVPFFMVGMHLWLNLIFSGLTEPLSALMLIAAIYLMLEERTAIWGVVLVSFLPFVRSEGLIMLCVFTLYLLYKKQWKYLPLLFLGHFVYGVLGAIWVHHDFWWIFNKVPYATTGAYSSGHWWDFLNKTHLCIGLPNTILFLLGSVGLFIQILPFKFWNNIRLAQEFILIYGCLSALILGHTIFWTFGIANSFGMDRVLITIFPCITIVILRGLNLCLYQAERIMPNKSIFILLAILPFFTYFPFLSKKSGGWYWTINGEQRLVAQMVDYIKQNIPNHKKYVFHTEIPYFAMLMEQDRFDDTQNRRMTRMKELGSFSRPSFVVWDSHFAFWDAQYKEADLDKDIHFPKIMHFASNENPNDRIALYRVDTAAKASEIIISTPPIAPTTPSKTYSLQEIKAVKEKMRKEKVWMESISKKAKAQSLSLDSMMTLDAIFMLNQQ
jgi:hypothetical protein